MEWNDLAGEMPDDAMESIRPADAMPDDAMDPNVHDVLVELRPESGGMSVLSGEDGWNPFISAREAVALLQSSAGIAARGLQILSDVAVPVSRPGNGGGFGAGGSEQSIVVSARVTVETKQQLEQSRGQTVVGVYSNARIAPFPSKDCDPTVAKGTVDRVATYLGASDLWDMGYKGKGVVIGIVDGGISNSMRLVRQVVDGLNANFGKQAFWDSHGNMTSLDALCMAPEAEVYDIRITDGGGAETWILSAIQGFDWAIKKRKATGKPVILSNSWGIYDKAQAGDYAVNKDHPFMRKLVEAIDAGIIVLFAAGNCGQMCDPVPAALTSLKSRCNDCVGPSKSIWGANGHPRVMTVGAANTNGELIGYSSQGPAALDPNKPDFCAISHFSGGYFAVDTGTSAACPVAAGVVALLKQAFPNLSHDQAKRALSQTARQMGGTQGWSADSGHGIINARAAYDYIKQNISPEPAVLGGNGVPPGSAVLGGAHS